MPPDAAGLQIGLFFLKLVHGRIRHSNQADLLFIRQLTKTREMRLTHPAYTDHAKPNRCAHDFGALGGMDFVNGFPTVGSDLFQTSTSVWSIVPFIKTATCHYKPRFAYVSQAIH
jgi:hypothetical protein